MTSGILLARDMTRIFSAHCHIYCSWRVRSWTSLCVVNIISMAIRPKTRPTTVRQFRKYLNLRRNPDGASNRLYRLWPGGSCSRIQRSSSPSHSSSSNPIGFLLQWPTLLTLAMFPVLTFMYVRLAVAEERQAEAEFGDDYRRWAGVTPRFVPRFLGRNSHTRPQLPGSS